MSVETSVSRDETSASLNTAAHATEHCALDADTLAEIGSALGRQVLVERSPELLALYTVAEISAIPGATFAGAEGIERLMLAPEPDGFRAVLRARFTEGQGQGRLTEELLARGAGGLAILAPHGGAIERGTDDQALSVYAALRRDDKPASAWIARGFNPATGAHTCWHVTSSEISELSFPRLAELFASGPFQHAVAFHGHGGDAIVVGGGLPAEDAHTAFKHDVADAIRHALRGVMSEPPEVVVELDGPLAGALRANVVNRVTAAGNGIQVEQPLGVRRFTAAREAIALAVAQRYVGLL